MSVTLERAPRIVQQVLRGVGTGLRQSGIVSVVLRLGGVQRQIVGTAEDEEFAAIRRPHRRQPVGDLSHGTPPATWLPPWAIGSASGSWAGSGFGFCSVG